VIIRLALRSLATRPLRTAVLAAGFGLGIAVMAELLGVGQVILEQARSPALSGGGDVLVAGAAGPVESARFVMANVIGGAALAPRVAAASPWLRASLYLVAASGETIPVSARGAIPSLQKAVGDPEIADQPAWRDEPADAAWTRPRPDDVIRAMDRFHPIPQDTPHRSWAEWLYFNGRTADGRVRFYLTFLVAGRDRSDNSPSARSGKRPAFVRLQLDRDGRSTNYSAVEWIDERDLLARAPDLDVGGNRVRLEDSHYRITLALTGESRSHGPRAPDVTAEMTLDATPGRALPPFTIRGARGWQSGYVVPVLSGAIHGRLTIDGETLALNGASGYHDHNWGFWEGVHWQWGQVASGNSPQDLSIVYGRVFPPASVADTNRVPGALALIGPDGPIAFATNVSIAEAGDGATPQLITVRARGNDVDLTLKFTVADIVRNRMALTELASGAAMDFLQLAGTYQVTGHAGGRDVSFTARGSAETFRP